MLLCLPSVISFYIHIPFCPTKCPYCDFYSLGMEGKGLPEKAYVQALRQEIARWTWCVKKDALEEAESIFFGGGTPSLFSAAAIEEILTALTKWIPLRAAAEVTLEMNPKTADPKKMAQFKGAGINRISMGVQSLDNDLLRVLGRAHNREEALECLTWALEAQFPQVNLDLMLGLPHQNLSQLLDTLKTLKDFPLHHLSAYELILEEHTPFYERYHKDRKPLPTTELVIEMRHAVEDFALFHGMMPYEISNWSKKGYESRHNLKYWEYGSFVGLGTSAVSFLRWEQLSQEFIQKYWEGSGKEEPYGVRMTNPRNLRQYMESPQTLDSSQFEWIDQSTARLEFIMMGLRKTQGIRYKDFLNLFSGPFPERFQKALGEGEEKGWLKGDASGFRLRKEGVLLSNEAIQLFM